MLRCSKASRTASARKVGPVGSLARPAPRWQPQPRAIAAPGPPSLSPAPPSPVPPSPSAAAAPSGLGVPPSVVGAVALQVLMWTERFLTQSVGEAQLGSGIAGGEPVVPRLAR